MGKIAASIKEKLEKRFAPSHMVIEDESHKHASHAGAKAHAEEHGSGESHFNVVIISAAFEGLSRLQRHRAVMECIAEEMKTVHALSLSANTP